MTWAVRPLQYLFLTPAVKSFLLNRWWIGRSDAMTRGAKRNLWSPISNRSRSARISSTRERGYFCARIPICVKSTGARNGKRKDLSSGSIRLLTAGHERAHFARGQTYVSTKADRTLSCHSTCGSHAQVLAGL